MKIGRERFVQNVIPDLRDNFKTAIPPAFAKERIERPEQAMPLVESLMSESRAGIEKSIADLETGEYRARVAVGSAEEGTRHPHDYIIQKGEQESVLYFVDPEHQMGKSKKRGRSILPRKGDLRPKISTLIGLRLRTGDPLPDISVIRYRAAAVSDPHLLKMDAQYEVAQQILETADIPDLLKDKEHEITFRLNVRKDQLEVQSRYADEVDLHRFLAGAPTARSLKGKAHSFNVIMRHFLIHLQEGHFHKAGAQANADPS